MRTSLWLLAVSPALILMHAAAAEIRYMEGSCMLRNRPQSRPPTTAPAADQPSAPATQPASAEQGSAADQPATRPTAAQDVGK